MTPEEATTPEVTTPYRDAVERLAFERGWDLRQLRSVPGYRERVVLKLPRRVDPLSGGKLRAVYVRGDGPTFERCYERVAEKLAEYHGIEVAL